MPFIIFFPLLCGFVVVVCRTTTNALKFSVSSKLRGNPVQVITKLVGISLPLRKRKEAEKAQSENTGKDLEVVVETEGVDVVAAGKGNVLEQAAFI